MQRSQTELQLRGAAVRTVLNTNLEKGGSGETKPLSGLDDNVVLRIGPNAEAVVAETDTLPYGRQAENSFATALSRLQSRKSNRKAMSSAGLSHLTLTEQLYHSHETEPVVLDRIPGVLGEAAHRGRLMTFG